MRWVKEETLFGANRSIVWNSSMALELNYEIAQLWGRTARGEGAPGVAPVRLGPYPARCSSSSQLQTSQAFPGKKAPSLRHKFPLRIPANEGRKSSQYVNPKSTVLIGWSGAALIGQ